MATSFFLRVFFRPRVSFFLAKQQVTKWTIDMHMNQLIWRRIIDCAEIDVYVWHCAHLVVHAGKEEALLVI